LEQVAHFYAPPCTIEEYEREHGPTRKFRVTNNSYVEDDEGKRVHISDLFVGDKKANHLDMIEIEDSLLKASQDDMDVKIARAVRWACTLDDIFYKASDRRSVPLPFPFKIRKMDKVKHIVKEACGTSDFGLVTPREGAKSIVVMTPGRSTIRKRLSRMIQESDLLTA
jgi:hypothetical protein